MTDVADNADGSVGDGRASRWAHRRPELLEAATEYVLDKGVASLTLRPLAAAIGVTISTVIRQFGSKMALIEEVTRSINDQLLEDLRSDPGLVGQPPVETLRVLWRRWLSPDKSRHFRLMFELYGLALQDGDDYQWFIESVVTDWLPPIEQVLALNGIEPTHARTLATVVLATLRGLHLDFIATADVERVDAAFEFLVLSLDPFS